MESGAKDDWYKFFIDAKIPKSSAEEYSFNFVQNRIQFDMLLDLDKDYLNAMGVTVMGDVIAILRHAKISHAQNIKNNILFKSNSSSSSTSSSSTSSNNYRSVSLKSNISKEIKNKDDSKQLNIKTSKPNMSEDRRVVDQRNVIKIKTSKPLNSNITNKLSKPTIISDNIKSKPVDNKQSTTVIKSKPVVIVRRPPPQAPPSVEPLKRNIVNEIIDTRHFKDNLKRRSIEIKNEESDSDSDCQIEEIRSKLAKKSIFDRLGSHSKSRSPPLDSGERVVSSSTSPPSEQRLLQNLIEPDTPDMITDIKIESAPRRSVEYTVALPPSFVKSPSGSVFARLGGKSQALTPPSNTPGKSILKISSKSLRISKSAPNLLLTTKRDPKTISSNSNRVNLIRSLGDTVGVLANPNNRLKDKISAKSRIGNKDQVPSSNSAQKPLSATSTQRPTLSSISTQRTLSSTSTQRPLSSTSTQRPTVSSISTQRPTLSSISTQRSTLSSNLKRIINAPSTNRTISSTKTPLSVKDRLTIPKSSTKKPVIESELDILAKSTMNNLPAQVKCEMEKDRWIGVTKANGGSGIKARLGFKKPIQKICIKFDEDDNTDIISTTNQIPPNQPVYEREILTNDEDYADKTLDGKKKVRFHCVEKKLIEPRSNRLKKRFPNALPYNSTIVW